MERMGQDRQRIMKILVAIPFLSGGQSSKQAIDSIVTADIFALNNGADKEVVDVLNEYQFHKRVDLANNSYVNNAWNMFLEYFLKSDYERLIIMNNDLILCPNWQDICESIWSIHPDTIIIPNTGTSNWGGKVTSGTAGVFITLNKKQAHMVYPIPDYIKVWYGDDWIYSILRAFYDTIVIPTVKAFHYGSTSIKTKDIFDLIEEDKKVWALRGEEDIKKRIKELQ